MIEASLAPKFERKDRPGQPIVGQDMLGSDAAESRELMRRIKVIGTARRRVPSRWFERIGAALDAGYGIYGGGDRQVRWATLLFNAEAAQWVANEEWHPQQQARHLADGRYELQVPYSDPTELSMDILRHGDSVTVTGDKALVAAIGARLARAAARYA